MQILQVKFEVCRCGEVTRRQLLGAAGPSTPVWQVSRVDHKDMLLQRRKVVQLGLAPVPLADKNIEMRVETLVNSSWLG